MKASSSDLTAEWEAVLDKIEAQFGERPNDIQTVLFLVGLQTLGQGPLALSKEAKVQLIQIGAQVVLEPAGYFARTGKDPKGWPTWTQSKPLPKESPFAQEKRLKELIIDYFRSYPISPSSPKP